MRHETPNPSRGRTPLALIRLDAAPDSDAVMTAELEVTIGGEPMRLAVTVPGGPSQVGDLLPVFRGLADLVVGVGARKAEVGGAHVSCRMGCGACCRQSVPLSESEARALKRLVDGMPEPRRSRVRERFTASVRRLADAGLLDRVRETNPGSGAVPLALDYFRLGLACPFLENESCSIHPHRPIACREYLVTSPAEECGRPEDERVEGVPLPAKVGRAVRAVDGRVAGSSGSVPLVLALEWDESHPESPPPASGPDLLRAFFTALASRDA